MRNLYLLVALWFMWGCQNGKESESVKTTNSTAFFVGTYTDTYSKGIYKYKLMSDGKLEQMGLVAETKNPSYLAISANRSFLLAVNEENVDGFGSVESYAIVGDSLSLLSRKSSGGAHPCHVATSPDNYVLVSNYTSGNVALLKLGAGGELSEPLDVRQHTGSGSSPRQQGPHAHSSWFAANGLSYISADLGTNDLWFSEVDATRNKLQAGIQIRLQMESGAGPRHLCFHPNQNWVYVVNELNSTVSMVKADSTGIYGLAESVSTLPDDFEGENTCADIHITRDGRYLYASNRGHNSIAIFKVDGNTGKLERIGFESTRGEKPRNFTLSPDQHYLLVANQKTQNIVSFKRSAETGLLEYVAEVEAPSPVCLLF